MARAYCLRCNEQVEVENGQCPKGHDVSTEDLGPAPWIGRALSHIDEPTAPDETGQDQHNDELSALLADLDDGGPADLDGEPADGQPATAESETDEASDVPADSGGLQSAANALAALQENPDQTADADPAEPTPAAELEALAQELAGGGSESLSELDDEELDDEELDDDGLGALDESIAAWDEQEAATVAPQADLDEGTDADLEPDATSSQMAEGDDSEQPDEPPPPTGVPVAAVEEVPAAPAAEPEGEAGVTETDDPVAAADGTAPTSEDIFADAAPGLESEPELEPDPEPGPDEESGPALDLTNFTASGGRVDTAGKPAQRKGLFGLFGR